MSTSAFVPAGIKTVVLFDVHKKKAIFFFANIVVICFTQQFYHIPRATMLAARKYPVSTQKRMGVDLETMSANLFTTAR